jgi:hypothetical protein
MENSLLKSYLLTDEREKNLWNDAIIVFDTSALLDIYSIPKIARTKIYTDVFEKLPNRLWIPFHVQYEYFKNRESCIAKPVSEKYAPLRKKVENINIDAFVSIKKTELSNKIDDISKESEKDDKRPYMEQTKIDEFKKNIDATISQIEFFKSSALKQIENAENEVLSVKDSADVLEALDKFFTIGREYSYNEILEITKEGKHRYEFKIPPGYGDLKEKKGIQIFGDLIIWKQILEYSKEVKKPIIFITNDIKKDEDWCYLDKTATEDRIRCPREELIKEIKDFSGVDFWMYNLPQFLHNANKYLKSTIKEDVIQNVSQFLNTKDEKGKHLKFKCDECRKIHKYHKSDFDLDFECVDSSERNMGAENHYVAEEYLECKCGNEIHLIFEVWEYPIGIHNYDSIEIDGAKLIESFYFTVNFYDEFDDDNFYTSDNTVFREKVMNKEDCEELK